MKRICILVLVFVSLIGTTNASAKNKTIKKTVKSLFKVVEQFVSEYKEARDLLAEVMYHENWHTDKEHLAAYYTGAVIMNRVKGKNWPNTVHDVVYQKGQYAVVPYLFTTEIPQECYDMAASILLYGTPDVPENVVYQATFKQGHGDWIPPINGEHFCYE